jgi:hypothetical protein
MPGSVGLSTAAGENGAAVAGTDAMSAAATTAAAAGRAAARSFMGVVLLLSVLQKLRASALLVSFAQSAQHPASVARCRDDRLSDKGNEYAMNRTEITRGVDLALAGDWDGAHAIAQKYENDKTACWLHAVLHKIEPDEDNARYWYRQAGQFYESYADPKAELAAIKAALGY